MFTSCTFSGFPGNFPEISRKFPGNFPEFSRKCPGKNSSVQDVLNFRECSGNVPELFEKNNKDVVFKYYCSFTVLPGREILEKTVNLKTPFS